MAKNKFENNLLKEHGKGFKITLDNFEKFAWFISRWNTINSPYAIFESEKYNEWYNEVIFGKELIITNNKKEIDELRYIVGTIDIGEITYTVGAMEEERTFDHHILLLSDYTKYYIDRKNMYVYVVNHIYTGTDKRGLPKLMYSVEITPTMLNATSDTQFIMELLSDTRVKQMAYISGVERNLTVLSRFRDNKIRHVNIREFTHQDCTCNLNVEYNYDTHNPELIRFNEITLPNIDLSGEKASILLSYERGGLHELHLETVNKESLNISVARPYILSSKACKSIDVAIGSLEEKVHKIKGIESIKTIAKTH